MAWQDTVNTGLNIGSFLFDAYQGYSYNQAAKESMSQTNAILAQNAEYSDQLFNQQKKYWALDDLQLQYQLEDLQALRPAYNNQTAYQAQRMDEQLAQAQQLNPMIDATEVDLLNTLTKDSSELASQYRAEASADINNSFSQQMQEDQRTMALSGINPNSGQAANYTTQMGISKALGTASSLTQATRNAETEAINRQSTALNYAKGAQLPTYQPSNNNAAAGSVIQSLSSAANTYGNLSASLSNQAQNSWDGAAFALRELGIG